MAEIGARVRFLSEEITHEFQVEVATLDWKRLLWHADDEPEGMKDLDLDEDDESGQPSAVSTQPAALPADASAAGVADPAAAGTDPANDHHTCNTTKSVVPVVCCSPHPSPNRVSRSVPRSAWDTQPTEGARLRAFSTGSFGDS